MDEVLMAARFATKGIFAAPEGGPPYYAVSAIWFRQWHAFAAEDGSPPGPVTNDDLTRSASSQIVWLSGSDWHLLHELHGGGPVLRRMVRELVLSDEDTQAMDAGIRHMADASLETALHRSIDFHTQCCTRLERDLEAEVARLEAGPWTSRSNRGAQSDGVLQARRRVARAAGTCGGGEELRSALQALLKVSGGPHLDKLQRLVSELCTHEEAQIVLACLLQAVRDADRFSLETWLEQADSMGIGEGLRPVRQHLKQMTSGERGGLCMANQENEAPSERLWRLSVAAVKSGDTGALTALISEAFTKGGDDNSPKVGGSPVDEELTRKCEQSAADAKKCEEKAKKCEEKAKKLDMPLEKKASPPKENAKKLDMFVETKVSPTKPPLDPKRRQLFMGGQTGTERRPRDCGSMEGGAVEATLSGAGGRVGPVQSSGGSQPSSPPAPPAQDATPAQESGKSSRSPSAEPPESKAATHTPEKSGDKTSGEPKSSDRRKADREAKKQERQERFKWQQYEKQQQERFEKQQKDPSPRDRGDRQQWRGSEGDSGRGYSSDAEREPSQGRRQRADSSSSSRPAAPPSASCQAEALVTLGLPPGHVPPLSELKAAYRKAAMKSHPDRPQNKDRTSNATIEFQRVKEAFDILSPMAPER